MSGAATPSSADGGATVQKPPTEASTLLIKPPRGEMQLLVNADAGADVGTES